MVGVRSPVSGRAQGPFQKIFWLYFLFIDIPFHQDTSLQLKILSVVLDFFFLTSCGRSAAPGLWQQVDLCFSFRSRLKSLYHRLSLAELPDIPSVPDLAKVSSSNQLPVLLQSVPLFICSINCGKKLCKSTQSQSLKAPWKFTFCKSYMK